MGQKTKSQLYNVKIFQGRLRDGKSDFHGPPVLLNLTTGVTFEKPTRSITFGMSPQEVLLLLGAPLKITLLRSKGSIPTRKAWNYFELGVDIIFDVAHSEVVEIKVHNNVISDQRRFGIWDRCNW